MPGSTEEITSDVDAPKVSSLGSDDELLMLRPGAEPPSSRNPLGYGIVRSFYRHFMGYLTPQMFGVFDDPTLMIDQSAALQAWLDECVATGSAPQVNKPVRALSQEPLAYAPGLLVPGFINLSRLDLHFDFDGGLTVGEVGVGFYVSEFFAPGITRRGSITWLADERASRLSDNAGLIFHNPVGCSLHVRNVGGFTNGYVLHSQDWWAAYNKIFIGLLQDCRYLEVLRCVRGSIPGNEFCNDNTFFGGRRGMNSASNLLGDAYGTVLTANDTGYKGHNTNRWYGTCYEMGLPAGATYRVPVLLDRAGVYNHWHLPRHESGKGPFGIADNGSGASQNGGCLNRVTLGYEAGFVGSGADYYAGWKQVGGAFGNVSEHAIDTVRPKWSSGPVLPAISASGTASPKIAAPYVMKSGTSSAPLRLAPSAGAIRANARCLNIASGAVLVEVDTSRIKTWKLTGAHLVGFPGRPFVQAFGTPPAWSGGRTVSVGMHTTNDGDKVYVCDQGGVTDVSGGPTGTGSNIVDGTARWDYAGTLADFAGGAPLVGLATDSWGTEQYVKGMPGVTGLFGGGYQTTFDAAGPAFFTLRDEVQKIHVGYYSGTSSCTLLGFELEGYPTLTTNDGISSAMQGIGISDPLPGQPGGRGSATADPGALGVHGFFGAGDIIGAAGAATGTPMGWMSTAGALAPAWTADTSFLVPGTLVLNDTDKIYELMSPGTSASSGGPTGTNASITDGTAKWRFLCLKSAFTPLPNMP